MRYNKTSAGGSKTMLGRAGGLIRHFLDGDQPAFTFGEAVDALKGSTREAVKKLMRDMVKRGLLLRLKEGVYWIIPFEQDPSTYFPNTHLVVRYLVGNAEHYIGYYSALELHSLTTQPSFVEQIVVNRQIKPSTLNVQGHRFQFIYHNPRHFFGAGQVWVDSFQKATCSDLEKTFVDCLFRPDYAGGIAEIAKALHKSRQETDYKKLLRYCERFNSQGVIKRLGFLLELLGIGTHVIDELKVKRSQSYILLEPSHEKTGKLNSTWYIQQNIEDADILSPIYS